MNAIDLLKQQHEEVNGLFEELEKAQGRAKASVFGRIADALGVHAEIEERIFYPACRSDETKELLDHSFEEHKEVKTLIADILDMKPSDPEFDPKCEELKSGVLDHVEEEHSELFPKVQKLLGEERLEELGKQMEEMASDLQSEKAPMKPRELAARAA